MFDKARHAGLFTTLMAKKNRLKDRIQYTWIARLQNSVEILTIQLRLFSPKPHELIDRRTG